MDFTWIDGERLIRFGPSALEAAPPLLEARGFERYALLTTERAARMAPVLAERAGVVLHVPPGPVPEAAAAVRSSVAGRPLVALGGGRVIDSAKAIAGADGLACAALPTTLSGAELTGFHRMPAGVDRFRLVRPSLVVAAPELMASMPLPGLAATAMNALAHAVEALYTPLTHPVAELSALRAAQLLAGGLGDREPQREQLALGGLLAGYASGSTGYAVHHVICQTLVRLSGSPHAETNAVVLPHAVRLMEQRAPQALTHLAAALGAESEGPAGATRRIAELARLAGPTTLRELGVREDQLPAVAAEAAARPELHNTPHPPAEAELLDLLRAAL